MVVSSEMLAVFQQIDVYSLSEREDKINVAKEGAHFSMVKTWNGFSTASSLNRMTWEC